MNIYYDPKADAVDIILKKGKVAETREIGRGMFLDVDTSGEPLTLEILDASERFSLKDMQRLSFTVANYPTRFGKSA